MHNFAILLQGRIMVLFVPHLCLEELYNCIAFVIFFFQHHPASAVTGLGEDPERGIILAPSCPCNGLAPDWSLSQDVRKMVFGRFPIAGAGWTL